MRPASLLPASFLLVACQAAPEHPAPPPAPPPASTAASAAPSDPAPPPSEAPSAAAAAPDMGFTIVAGDPIVTAEEPVVVAVSRKTGQAQKPAPRPGAPASVAAAGGAREPQKPSTPQAQSAQSVIRSHFSDIEGCYAPVAMKDNRVAGRVVVQWTVGVDGTPTAVAIVQDTLNAAAVTDCIKARARTWRFPPPGTGVAVVRFPFDLKVQ